MRFASHRGTSFPSGPGIPIPAMFARPSSPASPTCPSMSSTAAAMSSALVMSKWIFVSVSPSGTVPPRAESLARSRRNTWNGCDGGFHCGLANTRRRSGNGNVFERAGHLHPFVAANRSGVAAAPPSDVRSSSARGVDSQRVHRRHCQRQWNSRCCSPGQPRVVGALRCRCHLFWQEVRASDEVLAKTLADCGLGHWNVVHAEASAAGRSGLRSCQPVNSVSRASVLVSQSLLTPVAGSRRPSRHPGARHRGVGVCPHR